MKKSIGCNTREEWLKWEDRILKWFHKKASLRRKQHKSKGITDADGQWSEDPNILERTFTDYFQNTFASSCPSYDDIEAVVESTSSKVDARMNVNFYPRFLKLRLKFPLNECSPLKRQVLMVS